MRVQWGCRVIADQTREISELGLSKTLSIMLRRSDLPFSPIKQWGTSDLFKSQNELLPVFFSLFVSLFHI